MQEYKVVVNICGSVFWYKPETEILHRGNDLPAVEFNNGDKYWYKEGKLHRENNLPALELSNGIKYWYKEGNRHREDGPALEYYNGYKEWYYNGKKINCKDNEEFLAIINKKDNCNGKVVEIEGKKYKLQIL